ncbi:unnamed protein product [Macrosiphum euphorbiae]|uniref:Uncharacterized protein n=1 Tax=Macrosiphum euphorbiae TaxID=13131 RepID=A0AAV0XJ86_9HEMI|nr:unnamed protein product [Macrosiphum euphorbiae]
MKEINGYHESIATRHKNNLEKMQKRNIFPSSLLGIDKIYKTTQGADNGNISFTNHTTDDFQEQVDRHSHSIYNGLTYYVKCNQATSAPETNTTYYVAKKHTPVDININNNVYGGNIYNNKFLSKRSTDHFKNNEISVEKEFKIDILNGNSYQNIAHVSSKLYSKNSNTSVIVNATNKKGTMNFTVDIDRSKFKNDLNVTHSEINAGEISLIRTFEKLLHNSLMN